MVTGVIELRQVNVISQYSFNCAVKSWEVIRVVVLKSLFGA